MMNDKTRKKWDSAASLYDLSGALGAEKRWKPHKLRLFSGMKGKILFLALGTGLDIACFPAGQDITAIDISQKMIDKALPRVEAYSGQIMVRRMDVHEMDFPDDSFDQIYTSCTFCSVPDPVKGLQALHRVLKPGGDLKMFEHTGSRWAPYRQMLDIMNPLTGLFGPDVNRNTTANVRAAGFTINKVTNVYLDVVKTIEATVSG